MKKMAAVVGLLVFCATAFTAAQPKKIQRSCEERCEDYCPSSWERQMHCNVECEIKCRHEKESHAAPREGNKSGRPR